MGTDGSVAAGVTVSLDVFPEGPSVRAAVGPSPVQVGLEVVELGPAVLPPSLEQVFRPCGVGQPLDGAVGHAELSLNRASAVAGGQQRVDGGVLGAGAVGESVSGGPWRPTLGQFRSRSLLRRRLGEGRTLGTRGCARRASRPLRRSCARIGIGRRPGPGWVPRSWHPRRSTGPVAADDLDPRVILDVDQRGPVDTAFAHRVLVDANHTRDMRLGLRKSSDQPQDRVPADLCSEAIGQPGTGATGQGEADLGQHRRIRRPCRQIKDLNLLDERPPSAGHVFAREAPDTKPRGLSRLWPRCECGGGLDPVSFVVAAEEGNGLIPAAPGCHRFAPSPAPTPRYPRDGVRDRERTGQTEGPQTSTARGRSR